ncbi:PepSY-associated TM helix [Caulifigura coniformis]|uniref:PepSY-associated TM helix n=2 Tax=Caulifigura coniformis TaxID=2527983 RepID=A0A517SI35_9PLAN|nr:PepSY-associated TM helix [Caulifigura coniformis]
MIQWHWVSSALCLAGMILFTITGITLNHAGEIEAKPAVLTRTLEMPRDVLDTLNAAEASDAAPVPNPVATWLADRLARPIPAHPAEWSTSEVYLSMPTPGVDAWLVVDRETGAVEFERSDRGWIAYFNDLHKARHTGLAWKWFLDLFAIATLIFCVTGLYLLYFHARHRRMTWPVVALGLAIPWFLALLISHTR